MLQWVFRLLPIHSQVCSCLAAVVAAHAFASLALGNERVMPVRVAKMFNGDIDVFRRFVRSGYVIFKFMTLPSSELALVFVLHNRDLDSRKVGLKKDFAGR